MAYLYICDNCRSDEHDECEKYKGSGIATGICICAHFSEKSRLEQSVWDRDK